MGRTPKHQRFEDHGRVRVLVECPPQRSPSLVASLLEREGYEVRTCEGPTARRCDLLQHGSCTLVSGADVVVNMLGSQPEGREILEAGRRTVGRRRWWPSLTNPQAIAVAVDGQGRADGDKVVVVETPVTRRHLVGAIGSPRHLAFPRPQWGDGCP
ncbi:MAG: hypothetical protein U0P45_11390 [Acidimicrobiales bacterium]